MNVWFSSDTHFGHANIIRLADRPYADLAEMDEALIANWNSRVGRDDRVYFLGDLSFHRPEITRGIVRRLNGEIHLVVGNHDERTVRKIPDAFASVNQMLTVKLWEQRIVLCHYAMRVWNRSHYGAWQLYGHSHGTLPDDPYSLSMDVGVDPNGYRPVSFDEVRIFMSTKQYRPIDHHGAA
jgi:calcineurin-like phosphoesterase family protein